MPRIATQSATSLVGTRLRYRFVWSCILVSGLISTYLTWRLSSAYGVGLAAQIELVAATSIVFPLWFLSGMRAAVLQLEHGTDLAQSRDPEG
jgi:hypothetical protein